MMDEKQIVKHALDDYQRITGLRSYIVEDNTVIQSASEKNYFCKCLKISSKALEKCEECTKETYENARQIDKECIYSCHAGYKNGRTRVEIVHIIQKINGNNMESI